MAHEIAEWDTVYARVVVEARRYCEQHVPGWPEMAPYMQDLAVGQLTQHTLWRIRAAAPAERGQ